MKGPVGANEGFLCDVFDQIDIAHHAGNQPFDTALILDDQKIEGARIARQRALDELLVGLVVRTRGNRHECGE